MLQGSNYRSNEKKKIIKLQHRTNQVKFFQSQRHIGDSAY